MCDITYNVTLMGSKISFPNYVEKPSFHYYSTQTGAQRAPFFWHIRYAYKVISWQDQRLMDLDQRSKITQLILITPQDPILIKISQSLDQRSVIFPSSVWEPQ